jgi:hypothetical protein
MDITRLTKEEMTREGLSFENFIVGISIKKILDEAQFKELLVKLIPRTGFSMSNSIEVLKTFRSVKAKLDEGKSFDVLFYDEATHYGVCLCPNDTMYYIGKLSYCLSCERTIWIKMATSYLKKPYKSYEMSDEIKELQNEAIEAEPIFKQMAYKRTEFGSAAYELDSREYNEMMSDILLTHDAKEWYANLPENEKRYVKRLQQMNVASAACS